MKIIKNFLIKVKYFSLILFVCGLMACSDNSGTTSEITYRVTFDSAGGSSVQSQNVMAGQTAQKPANPTRQGYMFVDWFLGETAWDFATPITGDITLTAGWELEEGVSLVTFDSNGGVGGPPQMTFKLGDRVGTETDGGIDLSGEDHTPVNGELKLAGYSTVRIDPAVNPNPNINDDGKWYFESRSPYGADIWILFIGANDPETYFWPLDGTPITLYAVWSVGNPAWW